VTERAKPARFEARLSWPKMLAFAVLAGAMTAGLMWVSLNHGAIGWLGVAFAGACTLIILRQFFYVGPIVVVGPEGLLCRHWSDQVIPWRSFRRASAPGGGNRISFWLTDPDVCRWKFMARAMRRLDPDKLNNGDLGMMTWMLDCSHYDLAEAVHAHRPSLFGRR
jgi:hypothetical protein